MNKNFIKRRRGFNKKTYEEYLLSDEWREKRQLKAEQQNNTCERCGKVFMQGFHIHHKTYKHFMNEPLSDLMFLCANCHKEIHIEMKAEKNNKKKKEEDKKLCANCFFSQCMEYRGKKNRNVLWCNLKCCECNGNICSKYRKGGMKVIEQFTQPKKRKHKK